MLGGGLLSRFSASNRAVWALLVLALVVAGLQLAGQAVLGLTLPSISA